MFQAIVLVSLAGLAAAAFDPDLHAKYLTMPKSSFVEFFNAQNYSWKMTEYDNVEKFIACVYTDKEAMKNLPILTHDIEAIDLPENFDARTQWPQCEMIKDIYDQGNCGSCWTFGTATTASDRTCIHKGIHVRLSEQDLECSASNVCDGGNPKKAFDFWRNSGLVTQECKPYNIEELRKNHCVTQCVNTAINYQGDKHFAERTYRVDNNIDQIKADLAKNGPIQAAFAVFEDFHTYKSGIYVHTFGGIVGYHSVRIIGYGVENGMEYCLVANSWGRNWGDNGMIKVKSFQAGMEFEDYLITGMPKN